MTWFKVDDRFHSHPKVLALSLAAAGLWVRAGSWCAAHETDGRLSKALLRTFKAPPRLAQELVSSGLWLELDDGFLFKNWIEFQPTSAQALSKREAWKRQKTRQRAMVSAPDTARSPADPDPDPVPLREEKKEIHPPRAHGEQSSIQTGHDFMTTATGRFYPPADWRQQLERIGSKPLQERTAALAAIRADDWNTGNTAVTPAHVLRKWPEYLSPPRLKSTVRAIGRFAGPSQPHSPEVYEADRKVAAPWE